MRIMSDPDLSSEAPIAPARKRAKKAAKKVAKKRAKKGSKKAAKRVKSPAVRKKAAPKKRAKKAAKRRPRKSARKVTPPEPAITKTLEEVKRQFLDRCPRCSSAMKKTFINLGPNQRLEVNQCKVCKFYLPA